VFNETFFGPELHVLIADCRVGNFCCSSLVCKCHFATGTYIHTREVCR